MKISSLALTSASIFTILAALSMAPKAIAGHIITTSCTNSCVTIINTTTGIITVQDCCGGRIRSTIHAGHPPMPTPNKET